jgi:hypothetical protein
VMQKDRFDMKFNLFATGMAMMMCGGTGPAASGDSQDGHTTVVQDDNGSTVITQSGDPAKAEVRVEKESGRTTVYRRSGGNTAVVTQSTNAADIPPEILDWLRKQQGR